MTKISRFQIFTQGFRSYTKKRDLDHETSLGEKIFKVTAAIIA